MTTTVLNLILVVAIAFSGARADKIVGGTATGGDGVIPYIVSIRHASGFLFCGGTVYNYNYVITAAHCQVAATGGIASDYVIAGDYNKNDDSGNEQKGTLTSVYTHEDYGSFTNINDIAILTLSNSLVANSYVHTVSIPISAPSAGDPITISGWGTLSSGGSTPINLQVAHVAVLGKTVCNIDYGNSVKVGMICIGVQTGGTDTCQGDSGGPAVLESSSGSINSKAPYYQVGITSWGAGCAAAGNPGVYTEVFYFRDWIAEHTS